MPARRAVRARVLCVELLVLDRLGHAPSYWTVRSGISTASTLTSVCFLIAARIWCLMAVAARSLIERFAVLVGDRVGHDFADERFLGQRADGVFAARGGGGRGGAVALPGRELERDRHLREAAVA